MNSLAQHPVQQPVYHLSLASRGLGLNLNAGTAGQLASTGAAATVSALGILSALATSGSLAGPIGAAVAAAAGLAVAIYNVFKGCGQTCTATSNFANQVEPILQQNLQNYFSVSPRYASFQAAHLNNFDTAWSALVAACSNPSYQAAGQRCITDRERGACHYQANGQCWNWFVGYRDPISNDPDVVPDPGPVSQLLGGAALPNPQASYVPLLLIAAVVLGVILL